MTHSASPELPDHAGHSIRAKPYDSDASARTAPGNAWCFDCNVPIRANWTVELAVHVVE